MKVFLHPFSINHKRTLSYFKIHFFQFNSSNKDMYWGLPNVFEMKKFFLRTSSLDETLPPLSLSWFRMYHDSGSSCLFGNLVLYVCGYYMCIFHCSVFFQGWFYFYCKSNMQFAIVVYYSYVALQSTTRLKDKAMFLIFSKYG